jgi:hypothetical protein
MMENAAALGERHLVRADIEPAIHRRRIATDDFAAAPQRELDAESAFPCRRRTQDREYWRAQTLIPEEDEADHEPQQNQQTELLRARREQHGIT